MLAFALDHGLECVAKLTMQRDIIPASTLAIDMRLTA